MTGFADVLSPDKFTGVQFKRWQFKVTLWLQAVKVSWVSGDMLREISYNKISEDSTMATWILEWLGY